MNSIQMIKIDKLQPHPDNPRKNVGDVSELADSIRHSGIMQNLTVVPHEGGYRVVIGHRRLAAAKEAGLTELPCVVSDMDHIEQLHTMMSENMQRKDLTPPEEAWGVQMLLDLGETPEAVQKKTGMSRTTFYHRKAMAALPADELQASYERGGTLADYIALEGIKDAKTKAKLLTVVGTPNFQYEFNKAKRDEEYEDKLEDVLLYLCVIARQLKEDLKRGCWRCLWLSNKDWKENLLSVVQEIKADPDGDYTFHVGSESWNRDRIYIYRMNEEKETKPKAPTEAELKEEARKARKRALEDLHQQFRELRTAFICAFRENTSNVSHILPTFLRDGPYIDGTEVMRHVFGSEGQNDALKKAYDDLCAATPGAVMLAAMEMNREDVVGWYGDYLEPDDEDSVEEYLKLLVSLGYQESDAEKAYWDGTHELFLKEEEE